MLKGRKYRIKRVEHKDCSQVLYFVQWKSFWTFGNWLYLRDKASPLAIPIPFRSMTEAIKVARELQGLDTDETTITYHNI